MKEANGRVVFCRVTYNALALKAKSQTWLTERQACTIFALYHDEIEEAARNQYERGVYVITVGASELMP